MNQADAVNTLKSLASKNGSGRLRENSKTFTKADKRSDFRAVLNQYKAKICGNNTQLAALWDSHSTANGKHDMTGTELSSLMSVIENSIQNPNASSAPSTRGATPSFAFNGTPQMQDSDQPMSMRPSVDFGGRQVQVQVQDGRTRSHTPIYEIDDIPAPPPESERPGSDECYLQDEIAKHDAKVAEPKVPYARNQSNSFVNNLSQSVRNADAGMDDVVNDMAAR